MPLEVASPPIASGTAPAERTLTIRAVYFEGQINLKLFRANHPHYPVLASDPMVLEPEVGSFATLTKFGAVVFWNCSRQVTETLVTEVASLPGAMNRNEAVEDSTQVVIGKDEDKVTFHEIELRELTLEKVKLVSLVLGQSVALERFELQVLQALRNTEPIVAALQERGALVLSKRDTLKTIGFALGVRAAVLANLTLFDDPPETWESEALAHLDSVLYDHFNLGERLKAINQKVDYLSDVNDTLMNLLQHRRSHRLEWIIIILIFIEILIFIPVEFSRLFGGN